MEASAATGRRLLLLGRSLQRNSAIARDLGVLKSSAAPWISAQEAAALPDEELVIACTGSQAQPRAALSRLAYGELAGFAIGEGDHVVFSARAIPGNEGSIARLKDQIVRRGGNLIEGTEVHCSGHAYYDEQKELIEALRPAGFVPVHGDHRYLVAHAALAERVGVKNTHVLQNGDVLEIGPSSAKVVEHISTPRVCVDITPFGVQGGDALRTRRRLASRGLALVLVVLNSNTSELAEEPTIDNLGLFDEEREGALLDDAVDAVEDAVYDLSARDRLNEDTCQEAVRLAVMRLLRRETGRKVFVLPIVVYT